MDKTSGRTLARLAASGLEKCLQRLSGVSTGTWQLLGVEVFPGSLQSALNPHDRGKPAAAVYFNLKAASGLTALMLFDPAEIGCLTKGFTGLSFSGGARITPAEEVMLLELGNVVLNALVNPVLNALKKGSLPAVPQFAEGDAAGLAAAVGAAAGGSSGFMIVKASLALKCASGSAGSAVFALVPPELASELDRLPAPAGSV